MTQNSNSSLSSLESRVGVLEKLQDKASDRLPGIETRITTVDKSQVALESRHSSLETRFAVVEKSHEKLSDKAPAVEARVRQLENYWYITLALATILGIGGSWLAVQMYNLQAQSRKSADQAIAAVETAKNIAIAEVGSAAKTEADKYVLNSFSNHFKSGLTIIGGLNGNHGHWLDSTIKFSGKDGKPFMFENIPRVLASPDAGTTNGNYAWSVTVMKVTNTDFTVRIRSVDQEQERNPGWNGNVGVQWVAFSEK